MSGFLGFFDVSQRAVLEWNIWLVQHIISMLRDKFCSEVKLFSVTENMRGLQPYKRMYTHIAAMSDESAWA